MAKQPRVWTGTAWDTLAVTLPDLSNYSTTTQMNTAIDNAKGLVYITGTSFTTAGTIDITNCFSATYDNYRIVINVTACSAADVDINARLLSGTTPSSVSYYFGYYGWRPNNSSANTAGNNLTSIFIVQAGSSGPTSTSAYIDIGKPFAATRTTFAGVTTNESSLGFCSRFGGGMHDSTTSYDGLRLLTSTGTISGTLQVYGYRKS